jgi:hypothetical protein
MYKYSTMTSFISQLVAVKPVISLSRASIGRSGLLIRIDDVDAELGV